MARAIINEGSGMASERYAISFVGNPNKEECVYIGGNKDEAQRIVQLINASIDEEVAAATAKRDKQIERLNFALEKAIEQLYQYQSNYAIARGECIDNDNDIVTDWREEIWAIAGGADTLVVCPDCGGDGKETCHNPDHNFITAVGGEIGRIGCPGCGHDENHKSAKGGSCGTCNGTGKVTNLIAEKWINEFGGSNDNE